MEEREAYIARHYERIPKPTNRVDFLQSIGRLPVSTTPNLTPIEQELEIGNSTYTQKRHRGHIKTSAKSIATKTGTAVRLASKFTSRITKLRELNSTMATSSSNKSKMKDEVVPTKCVDWSLNNESESEKRFWWNKTYSISIWENNLPLALDAARTADGKVDVSQATDDDVWRGFVEYQIGAVYKVCPICKQPEQNIDLRICCYCASTVHKECSVEAHSENIAWKKSNKGFESHMCICFDCEDLKNQPVRPFIHEPDNARRAVIRALASQAEYPPSLQKELHSLLRQFNDEYGSDGSKSASVPKEKDAQNLNLVQDLVASYFQPKDSASYLTKRPIESKCGGLGVVAVKDIPRFTIIGVYPGYEDPLSGEQAKLGRPGPKYSLVDLNCADFYNNVFCEMGKTFTPFINEPNTNEKSNVAWIQETIKPEGRLSVMTVRDIKEGEEVLIGYGPLYPRTYPYTYDAYAYHQVDDHKNCFALWHWTSIEEKDANFVCYAGYDDAQDSYSYWETESEAAARKKAAKEKSVE